MSSPRIGTPLSPSATRVMLLGCGELGKEVIIALQRLGCEVIGVDRYENAPGMQVAHRSHVIAMTDGAALRALVAQEFLLGITNPKAIILFAAIFPQFIDPAQPAARQFLVLGTVYLMAEFVATAVYALCGRQIRRFVRTSRGVVRLNRATGGFFMGAGGLLLATNR